MTKDNGRVDRLSASPEPQEGLGPPGFDPARDYSVLNTADLAFGAIILEEMAVEVARSGAGRQKADEVDAAAQAVRLAIEILNDLAATVRERDSDSRPEGENSRSEVEGEARQSGGVKQAHRPTERPLP